MQNSFAKLADVTVMTAWATKQFKAFESAVYFIMLLTSNFDDRIALQVYHDKLLHISMLMTCGSFHLNIKKS